MSDPYAQDRAIAAANLEAEVRNERAVILELLQKLTADVADLKASLAKPTKAPKE